jgi:hypothetical protein
VAADFRGAGVFRRGVRASAERRSPLYQVIQHRAEREQAARGVGVCPDDPLRGDVVYRADEMPG